MTEPRQKLHARAGGLATLALLVLALGPGAGSGHAGSLEPRLQDLDGPVAALLVHEGSLVVGGSFTGTRDGTELPYLARWAGTRWWSVGPALDGPVHALASVGGDLVVGGEFTHAGGVPAAHVARLEGTQWSSLGDGTNGPVHALAVQADLILYVGGDFTTAGGLPAQSVARWLVSTWSPVGAGLGGVVRALTLHEGTLVAGGDFGLGGANVHERHLARFVGGEWRAIAPGIDGPVHAALDWQGTLVIGGAFLHADFVTPAHHVARLTSATWDGIGFGFGADDSLDTSIVRCLTAWDGTLVAGGSFALADLAPASHIARWTGTIWEALGAGLDGDVTSVVGVGDILYAGGEFTTAGGTAAHAIAGYRAPTWFPLVATPVAVLDMAASWGPRGPEIRWSLASASLQGIERLRVERAPESSGPWAPCDPAGLAPSRHMTYTDAAAAAPGPVWYRLALEFRDGGVWRTGAVRVATGPTPDALGAGHESASDGSLDFTYSLGRSGPVRLALYDVRGRLLRTLVHEDQAAGVWRRTWDRTDDQGQRVGRGVVLARLATRDRGAVHKIVLRRP